MTPKAKKSAPEEIKVNTASNSQPIIIHVKNLTDEKLYDVKVFDLDFEKQKKIGYSMGVNTISYTQFMHALPAMPMLIRQIQIIASGDYQKFVDRQVSSTIAFINSSVDGTKFTEPKPMIINPLQFQRNTAIMNLDFELSGLSQIELFHLMPEVSVMLILYPGVTINIANGLRGGTVIK